MAHPKMLKYQTLTMELQKLSNLPCPPPDEHSGAGQELFRMKRGATGRNLVGMASSLGSAKNRPHRKETLNNKFCRFLDSFLQMTLQEFY